MTKFKMLYNILKVTNTLKLLSGFFIFFIITAFSLTFVEPTLKNIGDSFWFCFASVTTIGYGDFTTTTLIGRSVIVILSLYGIILIAVITGAIVSFVGEIQRMRTKESVGAFLEKLEHLDKLSKEELINLSKNIKERNFKE